MSKWAIFAVTEAGQSNAPKVAEVEAEEATGALVSYLAGPGALPDKAVVIGQSPAMTHRTAILYDVAEDGTVSTTPY